MTQIPFACDEYFVSQDRSGVTSWVEGAEWHVWNVVTTLRDKGATKQLGPCSG